MDKSIGIIGAGIAGLAAGCYGQMSGYRTRIFELHNLPGGLCTAWKRGDYTFDGCIHWLVGSSPRSSYYRIWEELGALPGRRIVDHDEIMRFEGPGGRTLVIHADVDRLEAHMKEVAPADARPIHEFAGAVRAFARFNPPMDKAEDLMSIGDYARLVLGSGLTPLMAWAKYSKVTIGDYVTRFSDPFLREAIANIWGIPEFSVAFLMMTLGWMHSRTAGYPIGGSLEFAQAIERRYRDLGGEIRYRSRVEKILVENDQAVGVRLADGSEHRTDFVISAADGHATIFDMLEGRYADDVIRGYYEKLPIFPGIIQVSLGVARDLSSEPMSIYWALPSPVEIAGQVRHRLGIRNLACDPTMAPAGKSALAVILDSPYEYWKRLRENPAQYRAEKQRVAEAIIAQMDTRFPGIASQVEVVDVATPVTYERYTGNWKGSMEGWLLTPTTPRIRKTLPGLSNFYMAGQWVEPGGGVPTAAKSGRDVIQIMCKRDGRPFKATKLGAT